MILIQSLSLQEVLSIFLDYCRRENFNLWDLIFAFTQYFRLQVCIVIVVDWFINNSHAERCMFYWSLDWWRNLAIRFCHFIIFVLIVRIITFLAWLLNSRVIKNWSPTLTNDTIRPMETVICLSFKSSFSFSIWKQSSKVINLVIVYLTIPHFYLTFALVNTVPWKSCNPYKGFTIHLNAGCERKNILTY